MASVTNQEARKSKQQYNKIDTTNQPNNEHTRKLGGKIRKM